MMKDFEERINDFRPQNPKTPCGWENLNGVGKSSKLFDWAVRARMDGSKSQKITFYKSSALA